MSVWLTQTKDMSTLDHMFNKVVTSPPVYFIEDTLAHLHDVSGVPWCGVLVLGTAALRVILTLPGQITAQKVASKRINLYREMDQQIIPALRVEVSRHVRESNWSKQKAAASFQQHSQQLKHALIIQNNCHMAKLYLPAFVQIPVWVFTSVAIRNLSLMRETKLRFLTVPVEGRYNQLAAEGALWFSNLTVPDPTFILPLIVGLSFAANIFISSNRLVPGVAAKPNNPVTRAITFLLYGLSVAMVPITAYQPAAVGLYWATSGCLGTLFNLLLLSPRFKRLVRIPKTHMEPERPYHLLKTKIMGLFKKSEPVTK